MTMTWWLWTIVVAAGIGAAIRLLFAPEVKACFERDPAARNVLEVLLTYSGLHAVICHRIAHALDRLKVPVLPRLIMTLARLATGVEIHPSAVIGRGLFIDHGMGVVIGETAVLGERVTLFQGVTLGGTGKERGKRHPTIGDNVVIGAGAKVLGNITVGRDSMIGANAVVIRDVPEHSTVVGVPGRVTRIKDRHFPGVKLDHSHLPDPLAERLELLQREIDALEQHLKEHRNSQSTGR
jgi:serine O-acetyltransferase